MDYNVEKYNSISEASYAMNTHRKSIISAIKHNSGIYNGFLWKLENNNEHKNDLNLYLKKKSKSN